MPNDDALIRSLPSGVPGLDDVLGGGIPEFSFVLVAGGPGCGKTTLAHQIAFSNASPERKAIYFTIIGEPPLKMLRYQQQFAFFDPAKVEQSLHFVHLGEDAKQGLGKVLARIEQEVERHNPSLVVVDSFRSMMRSTLAGPRGELKTQDFMQRLAVYLTTYQATTFLIGEYDDGERDSAVFTVADGVIRMTQSIDRNSVVRKLQVVKMRGQAQIPGLQTMRITGSGVQVFPRTLKPEEVSSTDRPLENRLRTGVPALDAMLGGGIPSGYSVLLAGPSGSGKTVLSNQFLLEGLRRGEPGIVAVFEKRPNDYVQTTPHGAELDSFVQKKKLEILYLRPLDLSIDETLQAMREAVLRLGAKRAVIDSLSGLELALAPTFREDFRESLYRMVGALTGMGVTMMSTVELPDAFTSLEFSPQGIAFLSDAIIMQRYIEVGAELKRALAVIKVRGSQHAKELREYQIGPDGLLLLGDGLQAYEGLLTGNPTRSKDRT